MKLSRTLSLLLAGAALAAPVTWAQIEELDLTKMVNKSDDCIHGTIVNRQVDVYDHPVAGPEIYVTTLTVQGTSLNDGKAKTVAVKYHGGFIDDENGVYNSEAPSDDDVKVGNKIVAFYKWNDNMGADISGNALYAAHGGLYRTATTRRGTVVLGRGDGYAISNNLNVNALGTQVKQLVELKKEAEGQKPQEPRQQGR